MWSMGVNCGFSWDEDRRLITCENWKVKVDLQGTVLPLKVYLAFKFFHNEQNEIYKKLDLTRD